MKKNLLPSLLVFLFTATSLLAQTTGTYIVADNGSRLASCVDSLLDINDLISGAGIRDLDDPVESPSDYRILQLNGSIITENELTTFKYSDYTAVYVEKTGTTFNGHNGIQIFLEVLVQPTSLFSKDTLRYTVQRGDKVSYVQAFFDQFNFWSSGLETTSLQERILFNNVAAGTTLPIAQEPNWANVGAGTYKLKYSTPSCSPATMLSDSLYVIVTESPCHNVQIKNIPSVCNNEVVDLRPYVYVNGVLANSGDISNMIFTDKSKVFVSDSIVIDPANFTAKWNSTTTFPLVGIYYIPNILLGGCPPTSSYLLTTALPVEFPAVGVVLTKGNDGKPVDFQIAKDYFTTGGVVHKNVFQQLYIDNFNVFAGSEFSFFTDAQFQNPVAGLDLTPGSYYAVATNTSCANDSTVFPIQVKASDFDIVWQHAPALGKGYYTFNVPTYAGATYAWFVWGGSIVSGLSTNQVTVYFSETAATSVSIVCTITMPNARSEASNIVQSGVYLSATGTNDALEPIPAALPTGNESAIADNNTTAVYPNPAEGSFAVSGKGEFELKAYNTLGQLVLEEKNYQAGTPLVLTTKGMHVIHLNQNGKTQVIKVLMK